TSVLASGPNTSRQYLGFDWYLGSFAMLRSIVHRSVAFAGATINKSTGCLPPLASSRRPSLLSDGVGRPLFLLAAASPPPENATVLPAVRCYQIVTKGHWSRDGQ